MHWSRVDIIHPQLRAIERVDLHLLHDASEAMLGRLLRRDSSELSDKMHRERADVG